MTSIDDIGHDCRDFFRYNSLKIGIAVFAAGFVVYTKDLCPPKYFEL